MVTIKDIAHETGFSTTTVSNVIHGKSGRVSASTVEQIQAAIQKLGYVPNMSARSLVSSSSKVIGMINHVVTKDHSNFMEDPFHSYFTGAIEQALRDAGYYLMLRTIETSEELLTFLRNWNVDGLFFTGIFKDQFFDVLSTLKIPIVFIDSYVHHPNFNNVGLEDFKASYTATQYLIDKGHRRIVFASPNIKDGGVLQQRFLGYKSALEQAGIPLDRHLICENEMDMESCQAMAQTIANLDGVTGIVATADVMAAGLIANLRKLNLRVPDDLSIVGFDDISLCEMISPTLTTIHQDIHKKGELAVECMLQRLDGQIPSQTEIILPTYLVERESVKEV